MKPRLRLTLFAILVMGVFVLPSATSWMSAPQTAPASQWPEIKSYEQMKIPADNPMTRSEERRVGKECRL